MKINPMAQLVADNLATPRAFRIEAAGEHPVIYLYDVIGADLFGGVSDLDFAHTLADLTDAPEIHLRINSPGGDVFAARAMMAAIREHPARFVAHIDGVAASAASYLVTAADQIEITQGAFVMIHRAHTMAVGDAEEMLAVGALLEKVDASIVADYQRTTGAEHDQLVDWMAAETWFDASEAVEHGFADTVALFEDTEGEQAAALGQREIIQRWNLAAFAHAPVALLNDPAPPPAFDTDAHRRLLNLLHRVA